MIENLPCSKLGPDQLCPTPGLCSIANKPLKGVLKAVREGLGGAGSQPQIYRKLTRELTTAGNLYGVNLYPTPDKDGNMNICMDDAFMTLRGEQTRPSAIANAFATYAENAVDSTIKDLPKFRG